jgi:hypothetical protein
MTAAREVAHGATAPSSMAAGATVIMKTFFMV